MKINDNIMKMSTYKQIGRSSNVNFNLNSGPQTNKSETDTIKVLISGKISSKNITTPVKKINTAGLIAMR